MAVVASQPRSSDQYSLAQQRWHQSGVHVWTNAPFRTIRKIPVGYVASLYAERLLNSSLAALTYNYRPIATLLLSMDLSLR